MQHGALQYTGIGYWLCGVAVMSLEVEDSLGCGVLINVVHKNPGLQIATSHV